MNEGESVEGHAIRKGSTATPYTQSQFGEILKVLQQQKWKYEHDPEVFKITDQYLRHLAHSWLYVGRLKMSSDIEVTIHIMRIITKKRRNRVRVMSMCEI
jgi:hypothetical protein